MNATIDKAPSLVRAMPGKCPIPLPRPLGCAPSELDLLVWFLDVREWCDGQRANGRPVRITREGVIAWITSVAEDIEEAATLQEILGAVAPEDIIT
jgi:hypothetical protein